MGLSQGGCRAPAHQRADPGRGHPPRRGGPILVGRREGGQRRDERHRRRGWEPSIEIGVSAEYEAGCQDMRPLPVRGGPGGRRGRWCRVRAGRTVIGNHIEIHRRPWRRAWLKGPVVAMVLLTAAVSVACGTHSSAHQRVFRVTLIHVGLDHYPASLLTLVDGLQSLGWLSADQVRTFESEIKAVKRPTCSGE